MAESSLAAIDNKFGVLRVEFLASQYSNAETQLSKASRWHFAGAVPGVAPRVVPGVVPGVFVMISSTYAIYRNHGLNLVSLIFDEMRKLQRFNVWNEARIHPKILWNGLQIRDETGKEARVFRHLVCFWCADRVERFRDRHDRCHADRCSLLPAQLHCCRWFEPHISPARRLAATAF